MKRYITPTLEESLTDKYVELCISLGKSKEVRDIPSSRDELSKRIKELTFERMHKYHIN